MRSRRAEGYEGIYEEIQVLVSIIAGVTNAKIFKVSGSLYCPLPPSGPKRFLGKREGGVGKR